MARTIQQIIQDSGFETRAYSGRGMYGTQCLGVTIDCEVAEFFGRVLEDIVDSFDDSITEFAMLARAMRQTNTDSMGRRTIVYFPDISCEFQDGR